MSQNHLDTTIFGEPPPEEQRRRRRRRQRGKGRRVLTLLVAVVLVGAATATAFTLLKPLVSSITGGGSSDAEDFPGPGEGDVQVTVKAGDSGESIASALKAAGVVKTRTAYLDASAADPEQSARIQAGTYSLKKGMKAIDAFTMLTDPANRAVARATIPEGLWVSEIFARLSKATGVPLKDYQAAAKNPAALGLPASAKGRLDGYLFPSSYEFDDKVPAAAQLKQMVAMTIAELTKAGVKPEDYNRILTVASIVEGEVNGDADRAKVARVIENRLDDPNGPTIGRLQMDSTVHYIEQKRGRAGTSNEARNSDSPYNTYKVKGLPPGPINSPGAASIEAAAAPADGPWFYFVAVNPDTGETKFAVTQAEHDANVREFNAWCSANKDKC
ncbi:endolytic transglycosylase MltG [Knoellia locipacati]|uniref:Endolytic murein transglycosylase n=1 Tax=Knoellia locipacati TaxID=882824 RepID=A0A512T268_9MICO|nr:endolytic transglycosylase MltG [Knoellia locipacati]GEQ14299.1 ABC transporter substrate-binding protein [Knoellia locipacati]